MTRSPDVVVLGGGLAGLTLARHLVRETDVRVLILDRRRDLPGAEQKVGESTVQLGGYYLSRVLGLEEVLLREHYPKYNLRFYHSDGGGPAQDFAELGQCYIRSPSNVWSYQVDRNRLERHLFTELQAEPRVEWSLGVDGVEVESGGPDPVVRWTAEGVRHAVGAPWVVDASGRRRVLARQWDLHRPVGYRHGAAWGWIDGALDIEHLSGRSEREIRLDRSRRTIGHSPLWLATNHFCFDGGWLWTIPLHGRTSLGVVFDQRCLDFSEVSRPERLASWMLERFPLLAPALEGREFLGFGAGQHVAHDCRRTLSASGWAMTGVSGRFSDPLYSPGTDLISLHNTLIVDAVRAGRGGAGRPQEACERHERLLSALFRAYLPAYSESYRTLGDQECLILKYTWELSIYFGFYVFPFLNDLFTDRRFAVGFLRRFSRLGRLNREVQELVVALYRHKTAEGDRALCEEPHWDFSRMPALAAAAETFYEVGLDAVEARAVLDGQLATLERFAADLRRYVDGRIGGRLAAAPGRFDWSSPSSATVPEPVA